MKTVVILLILFSSSQMLFSQEQESLSVETNMIVDFNEEESWLIVQDWENLHLLAPNVVESTTVNGTGLYSTWDISLKSGGMISEKMLYYNPNEKTFSYIMTVTPMPISDYMAIIKVEEYGISKSLISFYTECKTDPSKVDQMRKTFKSFQENYLSNIEKLK